MTDVKTFLIADFEVDLTRSVIKTSETETQVEPKVLKVLLLLAQRQGEVVSHHEIMQHVWQGTEVVPNALQRCIAILRKVLGDDAKSPTFIATHPRIGYSLLTKVQWPGESCPVSKAHKAPHRKPGTDVRHIALLLMSSLALLLVILLWQFWPEDQLAYTQIQRLTQTDAHESHAIFSPNGEFIVFNRYAGGCKSHLWARELNNDKETRLTAEPGFFGDISFTPDGRELVFPAKVHCAEDAQPQNTDTNLLFCWNIATLDFAQGLSSPQALSLRHQCQADRLKNPEALGNHQYSFLQYIDGHNQLMQYDDLSKKLTTLFEDKHQHVYHYDYDPASKHFAILSRDKELNNRLTIVDEHGRQLTSVIIGTLGESSQNFNADFEPQGQYLMAISNQRLYRLDFDGSTELISTPQNNLISATLHPLTGELLAVTGHKDTDIAQLTIGEQHANMQKAELNQTALPYPSLSRTRTHESHARYQPQGEYIAFVSDRTGEDQIWLWHQDKATQLSSNNSSVAIRNFSWSPDGKQLSWAEEGNLVISDLEGKQRAFASDKPLYSVLTWFSDKEFLVLVNDPHPGGLYLLNIEQNTLTAYEVSQVDAAWVKRQRLFYSTIEGKVFSRMLAPHSKHGTLLQRLNGKAMVIKDDAIYSVDANTTILNQYNLHGELVTPIMALKGTAWKVTDIRQDKLLLSQFIGIHQEIVLLH